MAVLPSAAVPIMRPHLPPLDQFAQLVAELFETRMLSNFGKYTGLLEERASGLLDHPSPLCVSSCDIGLTLAWQALECPPGEVIVPSFTFCSTVNALR
jgi:dTDP-4-amino-4,6-dideoxygalactose transaminase